MANTNPSNPRGSQDETAEELQRLYELKLRMSNCAPNYIMRQRFKLQAAELALKLEVLQATASRVVSSRQPSLPDESHLAPHDIVISTSKIIPPPHFGLLCKTLPPPSPPPISSAPRHTKKAKAPRSATPTPELTELYGDLDKLVKAKTELADALREPGTGNLESLSTLTRMISFELPLLEENLDRLGEFVEQLGANQADANGNIQLPLLVLVKITLDGEARYIPALIRTLKRRSTDGLLPKALKTGKPLPVGVMGYNDITVMGGSLASFLLGKDESEMSLDFAVEEVCRLANLSESWRTSEIKHLKWLSPFKLSSVTQQYTIKPFLTCLNRGNKWSPKSWPAKNWPLYVGGWSFNQLDQPLSLLPLLITKNRTTREKMAIGHSNLGTGGTNRPAVAQRLAEVEQQSQSYQNSSPSLPSSSVDIQTSNSLADSAIFSLSNSSQLISVQCGIVDQAPLSPELALDLSAFDCLYTAIENSIIHLDDGLPPGIPPMEEAALQLAFMDFGYPQTPIQQC